MNVKKKRCGNNSFFNIVNCSCEMKKMVALIEEECKEISDNIKKTDSSTQNKTLTLIKK